MPRSEVAVLQDHLETLIRDSLWDTAFLHARLALEKVATTSQAGQLLQACEQVPKELRLTLPWAGLLARLAFRANAPVVCAVYTDAWPTELGALSAWVLMTRGDSLGALRASEVASSEMGDLAGVAWRMRAWAIASLGHRGWEQAYRDAAGHNQGRQRGLCLIQLGAYLSFAGQQAEARTVYAEAGPYLRHDPELQANASYNVGVACLRLHHLDAAERAFQEAMTAAARPEGLGMLARAWSGLGHVYRARAEYPRALHAYHTAQVKATEAGDVAQAGRGKAHTLRLTGQLDEALGTLYEALYRLGEPDAHALYADMAAVQVMLGDEVGAEASLGRIPSGQEEEAQRAQVVRAELARRRAQLQVAEGLIHGFGTGALWSTEEARLFPELFALIGLCVMPPEPMVLSVQADGPVRVTLNRIRLPLYSDTPAASLLALLASQGGHVTVEQAMAGLTLTGATERLRRQGLSRTLGVLRDVLGWPEAVETDGHTLSLDPRLRCQPVQFPAVSNDFCAGLDDPWIGAWREDHHELNVLLRS